MPAPFLRCTALLSLIITLVSAAEQVEFTFSERLLTVKQIIEEIEAQSDYHFAYNPASINVNLEIRLPDRKVDRDHVLKLMAGQLNVEVQMDNYNIYLKAKKEKKESPHIPQQQTGSIKGRVVEFETTEPLPGASIVLAGTSTGTTSDVDGYYRFNNLQEGRYTVQVTFIGYETYSQSVEVKGGSEVTIDIKLRGATSALNEVVVQGRRALSRAPVAHTSEAELIEEIKESRAVVSGISNEMISKTADRNAAEVVKRISGVTVVDDKFIVVRGMNQRYNITYLNGNLAPSTETYNRSFAYDMIPSSVIDRILIYKSPSAELMGDFSGGAVKVFTKDTKAVRHLDVGLQLSYREGTTFGTMNDYAGGKYDFLGIDDGTRKLPNIPSFEQTGGHNTMTQKEMVGAFSDTWVYGQADVRPDMQLFLNYFDNWRLAKGRLHSLTSLTYTNENRRYRIKRQTGNTYAYSLDKYNGNVGSRNSVGTDDQSTEIAKVNLLQNFTWVLDSAHRLEFRNFLLNDGRNTTSIRISRPNVYPDLHQSSIYSHRETKQNLFRFQQRFLYNGNVGGQHTLGGALATHLHWNLGYSYSKQDIPDQRISNFWRAYNPGGKEYYNTEPENLRWYVDYGPTASQLFYGMMSRFFVSNREQMYNGSWDITVHPFSTITLKAGTYQVYRTREVARRFFRVSRGGLSGNEKTFLFSPGGTDDGGTIDPNLLSFHEQDLAWIWDAAYFPENGKGLGLYDVSNPTDSYFASEQNNSGYLQGEWAPLNGKLVINAGMRFEFNRQKIVAGVNAGGMFAPILVDLSKPSWLPSTNISYKATEALMVRAGYGRTVNRPELREISPFSDYEFVNREHITGNPSLVGTVIDNVEMRIEYYPGNHPNEAITLGAFYKILDKPIERLRLDEADGEEISVDATHISFFNPDRAEVKGIELELRKSLSFIPGSIFRNLSAVINGALVESSVSRSAKGKPVNAEGSDTGSFSGRPLQGQAPYVFNAGLFYENPGWGTKIGLIYNVNGENIYAIANTNADTVRALQDRDNLTPAGYLILGKRPNLLELSRRLLDLSFTQRLYKSLQLRFTIQNLLDSPYRIVEDQNYNYRYDKEVKQQVTSGLWGDKGYHYYKGDNDFIRYNTGRFFTATLTYSF